VRRAKVTAVTPDVLFRVHGATVEQFASLVVGHRDPAVDDEVLVERIQDTAQYVMLVPR
jgi:hypothetical protein